MTKTALRSLLAHRLRLALTGLAIILAVAFVAGTYVFTDSLHQSLDSLLKQRQPDVIIEAGGGIRTDFSDDVSNATLPASLVPTVEGVDGVAEAVGWVRVRNVTVLGTDGKPLGGGEGPGSSGQGQSWIPDDDLAVVALDAGTPPAADGEIALDTVTADRAGFTVGSTVKVVLPRGTVLEQRVTALVTRGLSGGMAGGRSITVWDQRTAQRLLLKPGELTQVRVKSLPGFSQDQLARNLEQVVPRGARVQTGQQVADDTASRLEERLGFLNTFLLVFALIALFVAAFLIYNTFSMLVAQRTRELALLRAIGATRRQVTSVVLAEAMLVALIASTVGLVAGGGIALLLRGLFSLFGAPLPGLALVFLPRTIIAAYAIGMLVTLVSAWVPARRAATIPPVAALRDEVALPSSSLRLRRLIGAVLIVTAAVLAVFGLRPHENTNDAALLVGLSAAAGLVGLLALAPVLARPVLQLLALPLSRSAVGRIARENGRRNPRRTAATAGALMIGLTLMSALSVIAASTTRSTDALVDDVIGADFVIFGGDFQPFPHGAYEAVRGTPGTSAVMYVRATVALVPGGGNEGQLVTGVQPEVLPQVVNLDVTSGSLDGLGVGTVAVDSKTAQANGIDLGSTVEMLTQRGMVKLRAVALYTATGPYQGFVTSNAQVDLMGNPGLDTAVYVKAAPGANPDAVRAELEQRLKPFPTVTLQDQTQFKQQIRDQVNRLLVFIFALLVLAVIIAVLGIVNTLALSVFERTREIGLLRAVGTTRAQIRRMVFIESVLIAVFGAVLGMVLGVTYGVLLQRVLAPEGITELGLDIPQLALFLALSAVAGIGAAIWPAIRAARLDVLKAIATE